jgi:hypothetical protein
MDVPESERHAFGGTNSRPKLQGANLAERWNQIERSKNPRPSKLIVGAKLTA